MATTTAPKFQVGDLVWAKMKGFSPWPGKLVDASQTSLKKPPGNLRGKVNHCVYFFGSNNFAWLPEDSIKPYQEFKEANLKLCKTKAFQAAVELIEDFIRRGCPEDDTPGVEEDLLPSSSNLPSIDDDVAAIFADGKTDSSPVKSNSTSSSTQKDYSRKPFSGKTKRLGSNSTTVTNNNNSSNNVSDDDSTPVSGPPAKRSRANASIEDNGTAAVDSKAAAKTGTARNILNRNTQYLLDSSSSTATTDGTNELDVGTVSAKSKAIRASSLKFGFIGLGTLGQRLLKNLLNSGHTVTIWNRTPSKCKDFVKAGATKVTTPADVVASSDITFSCLSDPHAVKEIVFGNCGVLQEIRTGKGFVEMTTIDAETSNDISEAILARGGRYLEAPVIGSGKQQAEEGNLTIIVSGDKTLFDDCHSCFQAISNQAFYLGGQIGDAAKMSLVVSMLIGNLIGSLAESMALADRTGLSQKDLLEILSQSPLNCQTIISKGRGMIEGGFAT